MAPTLRAAPNDADTPQAPSVGSRAGSSLEDDDLAPRHSPVAGPFLTEGEYLTLRPERRWRADLDGDGIPEEVVLVRFATRGGEGGYSLAVLKREGHGYRSSVLHNGYAPEFHSVEVATLDPHGPARLVLREQSGSGGFLQVSVLGWKDGKYGTLWSMDGVYQGRCRLTGSRNGRPAAMRLTRSILESNHEEASPGAEWREQYVWQRQRFVRVSRRRVELPERDLLPEYAHPLPPAEKPTRDTAVARAQR